jgi:hypothetical protein
MTIVYKRFTTAADMHEAVPDGAHSDDLARARLAYAAACGEADQHPSVETSAKAAAAHEYLRSIMKARGIL